MDQVKSTSVALLAWAEVRVGVVGGWLSRVALTVTVTCAVALPALLLAVSVYVVVLVGHTTFEVTVETVPIPLSSVTVVAEATVHDKLTCWPGEITEALALKDEIVGTGFGAVEPRVASTTPPKSAVQYQP